MTTMKRISIQMPGGRAELSSGGAQLPKKQSSACLRVAGPPQSTKSDQDAAITAMTPCSDGGRVTRIYYYKYPGSKGVPSSGEKLYLSTAACGFGSGPRSAGRTPSARASAKAFRRPPSKWASAGAEHNLVAMNYHLSELSLHYRAPSEAANPRPAALFRDEGKEGMEDAPEEEEEIVSPPPPPSSSVPSPRESTAALNAAGGSATTSSCPIPDPEEFVQKSTSNRLLNVISIDECHLKHRQARKRVKPQKQQLTSRSAFDPEDNERFLIPEDTADCPSLGAGSMGSLMAARSTVLDRIERLNGFRSVPLTARGGSRAQQLFSRRNQLLREHMNVYVAWRTSERLKERVDKMRGVRSAIGVLEASKEDRLKAFSAVLRSKEMEFAQLNEAAEAPSEGSEEAIESDDLKEALVGDEDDDRNKLTRMWEVLQ